MNTPNKNRVDEILNSLDGSQRATIPPYFYTRLKARLENDTAPAIKRYWFLQPAYAFAALVLVILINVAVILKGENTTENNTPDTEVYQSIAAEYNLNENITEEVYK